MYGEREGGQHIVLKFQMNPPAPSWGHLTLCPPSSHTQDFRNTREGDSQPSAHSSFLQGFQTGHYIPMVSTQSVLTSNEMHLKTAY
jgi:hypothetical protein